MMDLSLVLAIRMSDITKVYLREKIGDDNPRLSVKELISVFLFLITAVFISTLSGSLLSFLTTLMISLR